MVTLLDDRYQYAHLIPPGRAHRRASKGLAEWVTAAGVQPNTYFGTLRMFPRPDGAAPAVQRMDTTLLLGSDGVPVIRLSPRGHGQLRNLLRQHAVASERRGRCIILLEPLDEQRRQDIIRALAAGVADGVARRAALRYEVTEILLRAGVVDPSQASHQDLDRIARLLFADLKIRQDAALAEIIVLLGRAGEVLGRPEVETQPDMYRLRALMDAARKADQERGSQQAPESIENEAAGGQIEDIGSRRSGHAGGRQSVAAAQARAAAAGQ